MKPRSAASKSAVSAKSTVTFTPPGASCRASGTQWHAASTALGDPCANLAGHARAAGGWSIESRTDTSALSGTVIRPRWGRSRSKEMTKTRARPWPPRATSQDHGPAARGIADAIDIDVQQVTVRHVVGQIDGHVGVLPEEPARRRAARFGQQLCPQERRADLVASWTGPPARARWPGSSRRIDGEPRRECGAGGRSRFRRPPLHRPAQPAATPAPTCSTEGTSTPLPAAHRASRGPDPPIRVMHPAANCAGIEKRRDRARHSEEVER